MTFLGKIFILAVLVLSVFFLVAGLFVNARHTDFKGKIADLEKKVRDADATIDELKKGIQAKQSELNLEQVARRASLAALQTQKDAEQERLQQNTKVLNEKNSANTAAIQNVGQTVAELKRVTEENEKLRVQNNEVMADRNAQRKSVIKLTDDLNALKSIATDLEDQVKLLQDQATRYQAMAETRGAALASAGIIDPEDVPPTDLRGIVLAADNSGIEVSIGRDDGIRQGHLLDIYRGANYLGRIQINNVLDDKASGKIVPGYQKGRIQVGDKVAPKIN